MVTGSKHSPTLGPDDSRPDPDRKDCVSNFLQDSDPAPAMLFIAFLLCWSIEVGSRLAGL